MWVTYLGDSMSGMSSAKNANLNNLRTLFVPTSGYFNMWDGTRTAGDSVDPATPWTTVTPRGTVELTDAANPLNYKGYQDFYSDVTYWRDTDQLYTDGSNKKRIAEGMSYDLGMKFSF
jgi:hypothetical protein